MTLDLVSTCVGGRRVDAYQHLKPAEKRHAAARAGMFQRDDGAGGRLWGLTRREVEVLEAVIRHGFAKVAGHALGMSVKTVECHMGAIKQKARIQHIAPLVAAYVTAKLKAAGDAS